MVVGVPPAPRPAVNPVVPPFPLALSPSPWWCDTVSPVVAAEAAAAAGVAAARSPPNFSSLSRGAATTTATAVPARQLLPPAQPPFALPISPNIVPFSYPAPPSVASFCPRSFANLFKLLLRYVYPLTLFASPIGRSLPMPT